jgi:hypothetical protein
MRGGALLKRFQKKIPAKRHNRARLPYGEMNGTEKAYDRHLKTLLEVGAIAWYKWQPFNLPLGPGVYYRPDFLVQLPTGELEVHEVKGHWEEDARVKIRLAATIFPFLFVAITVRPRKEGGGWEREEFTNIQAEETAEVDA